MQVKIFISIIIVFFFDIPRLYEALSENDNLAEARDVSLFLSYKELKYYFSLYNVREYNFS